MWSRRIDGSNFPPPTPMNHRGANIRRILGVFILLAGVALIVVSRDGPVAGTVLGVILLAGGFWLSYVQSEIMKMRQHTRTRREVLESAGEQGTESVRVPSGAADAVGLAKSKITRYVTCTID